jgi:hypothetical protein
VRVTKIGKKRKQHLRRKQMKKIVLGLCLAFGMLIVEMPTAKADFKNDVMKKACGGLTMLQSAALKVGKPLTFSKACEDACAHQDLAQISGCIKEYSASMPKTVSVLQGLCKGGCNRGTCMIASVANACGTICCAIGDKLVTNCLKNNPDKTHGSCDTFTLVMPAAAASPSSTEHED